MWGLEKGDEMRECPVICHQGRWGDGGLIGGLTA